MPKITEMYAFVMADSGPDDEGIPSLAVGGMAMPMVGADMAMVANLRPFATTMAMESGKEIRILRFTKAEVFEVIKP